MTRVLKIGGRPQGDLSLPGLIAEVWDALSGALVIVHGGGAEVSALQSAMGLIAQFTDGRRVTTAQDLELVRMALSGTANKRLVSALGVPTTLAPGRQVVTSSRRPKKSQTVERG